MVEAHRSQKGKSAHRRGHWAEYIALIHLMLKGYYIIGFRLKTPEAEIDIVAVKKKRLALIEVKQRRSLDEAIEATTSTQQKRLWQAGLKLQERHPRLQSLDLNLDLYVLAPKTWPRHIKSAFEG